MSLVGAVLGKTHELKEPDLLRPLRQETVFQVVKLSWFETAGRFLHGLWIIWSYELKYW